MKTTYSIDLQEIASQARDRRDEFDVMRYQFQYDDTLEDDVLDTIVEDIAQPIIEQIDCTACGNCCRALDVYLDQVDVASIAEALDIPQQTIIAQYIDQLRAEKEDEWGMFKQKPCTFLVGKKCSIYAYRPQACRDYPVLTPYFRWIMEDMLDGAMLCPILYHVLDAMSQQVDAIIAGTYKKV